MALDTRKRYYNVTTGVQTEELYRSSQMLCELTGKNVQVNKAIVGANAFAHEAGIHQDGMLKNAVTYEIMSPDRVGVPRSMIVLGKHSGRHALEARYRELFENASDVIYTHDLDGNITSFNRAGERLLGYTREAIAGPNIAQLLVPEHLDYARRMIAQKIEAGGR